MVAEAPKKSHRPLTAKEEAFAQHVANGKTASEAYGLAYSTTGDPKNFKIAAYAVGRRPHVAARIDALTKPDDQRLYLTRARKRELLREMAEDKRATRTDRQRAIDIDNRMTAEYTQNVRVEGEVTLGVILSSLGLTTGIPAPTEIKALSQPIDVQTEDVTQADLPAASGTAVLGPLAQDLDEMGTELPLGQETTGKRRFYDE